MTFRILQAALCTLIIFFSSGQTQANVKLSHQAINVVDGETNPVLTVKSDADIPQVLTAKITDLTGEDSANFIVIPTVTRLEPGQEVVFRVLPRDGAAIQGKPAFMERFIVTTIPARRRAAQAEPGTASAQLNINLAYNLPLVYHGASKVQQPWEQLKLVATEEGVVLRNPTTALIRLSAIKQADGTEIPDFHYNYIGPNSDILLPNAPSGITFRPINYFGFMLSEQSLSVNQ